MVAYLYKWITKEMLSEDHERAQKQADRLLQVIANNANAQPPSSFSFNTVLQVRRSDRVGQHQIIVNDVVYQDGMLFGSIGICSQELDGMVRERNLSTGSVTEIRPTDQSAEFEYYTYFGIKAEKKQLLVLKNGQMPKNIHEILAKILSNAIRGEPYAFHVESYRESTLRESIKAINRSKITLGIALADLSLEGKPSIKLLKKKADKKGAARVTLTLHYEEKLDDEIMDALLETKDDPDTRTLTIIDKEQPSNDSDAINLIKDLVTSKREIKVTKDNIKQYGAPFVYKQLIKVLTAAPSTGKDS